MPDEILIRFSVKDDGTPVIQRVNEKLGQTKKQSQALVPGLENARKSLTDFASSNAALIGILVGVGAALNKVIQDHLKYADAVRQQALISGTSTEEASRYIQVLDDYKISAEEALAATRFLTNAGHVPSIATLAKLSDQYLALNNEQERNAFVLKNLGRGGMQWIEVLQKGSKALLEQGDAIDKNLLLTQKMVDDARRAEIATDNWNDSVAALKTQLAANLLPALTNVVVGINEGRRAAEIMIEKGLNPANKASKEYREALRQAHEEQVAATDAMIKNKEAMDSNAQSAEALAEAQKALSDHLQGQISLINSMQSAEDTYTEKSKDLAEQRAEAEAKLAQLRHDGYWEQGKDIQSALADLETIKAAEADLAAERDKQTLQFISNILAEQLARDGWTQTEFDAFAKQQEAWGLWSADVVAKAQAAWREADHVAASINGIPSNKTVTITTNYVANYSTNYTPGVGMAVANPNPQQHAAGGVFMIPQSYGNEGFPMGGSDTASGGEKLAIAPKNKDIIDYDKLARKLRDAVVRTGG